MLEEVLEVARKNEKRTAKTQMYEQHEGWYGLKGTTKYRHPGPSLMEVKHSLEPRWNSRKKKTTE